MRALLLLALGVPLAAAWPTSTDWGSYEGIAVQGSRDESWDWAWRAEVSCTQALEDFVITLTIDVGSRDDRIVLETPVGIPRSGELPLPPLRLAAYPGHPATAYSSQNDGCPEFAVIGDEVAAQASYHVDVAYCLTPIEIECV